MVRVPITITHTAEKYEIVIVDNVLSRLSDVIRLEAYSNIMVLTDTTIEKLFIPLLKPSLPAQTHIVTVNPGEQAKSIESAVTIWNQMMTLGLDRKSLVINIGGGVISDLGGFVASTFMRGVDFIQIPTTLLAMVDASVGGKTGINFSTAKNMIGTFTQPKLIIADVSTLKTLPQRELSSGFAEILKHGLIRDMDYFKLVSMKAPTEFTNAELMNIIERSVRIKSEIIAGDVKELTGTRKLLNFGHTIGHAIESRLLELNTPILHGEAIALGIVAEAKLSEMRSSISAMETKEIQNALIKAGLPITIPKLDPQVLLQKMKLDKKNENGIIKFTLLQKMGQAIADCQIPEDQILLALQTIIT